MTHRRPHDDRLRTGVGVILVALPLALGGAHPITNLVASVAMVTLLVVALRRGRALRVTWPALLLGGALILTALQLVPMPRALIGALSPGTEDVLATSLRDHAAWAPFSLDPPATAHEVLKLTTYLAAVLLAGVLFGGRRRRQLLVWISGAGGGVAAVGLVHELAGVESPWGIFGYPVGHFTATFINPNHMAGFLGFCSIIALGLAVTTRDNSRWIHGGIAVLTGTGVLLSMSRGAMVTYVGAMAFLGLLALIGRSNRVRGFLWVQVCLAGVFVVSGYLAFTRIVTELFTIPTGVASKSEIWTPVPRMLAEFPALGVGRGAFFSIYPKYRLETLPATFTHLENEWLQLLVDYGPVVGCLLVLGCCAIFALVLKRGAGDPTTPAVAAAILFVAIHNLGDFSLELTAVALPVAMVAAVFVAEPRSRRRGASTPLSNWVGAALLATAVVACALPAVAFDLPRDTARLRNGLSTTDDRDALALAIIRRHPADYLLPLLVAERALGDKEARASLPWINRGMYLAPTYAPAHRLAARALLRLGATEQALVEYRLACEKSPRDARHVVEEVWQTVGDAQAVAQLAGDVVTVRLAVARSLAARKAFRLAASVARARDAAQHPELLEIAARAACETGELDRALEEARRIEARWPRRHDAYLIEADVHKKRGDLDQLIAVLQRGTETATYRNTLASRWVDQLIIRHEHAEARRVAEDLLNYESSARLRGWAHAMLGRVYESESRFGVALREFSRARDLHPQALSHHLAVARVRERVGDIRGAREELSKARAFLGQSEVLDTAIRGLNAASDTP